MRDLDANEERSVNPVEPEGAPGRKRMTIDEIKELIRLVQETGVAELEVQRGDNRVRIRITQPYSQEITLQPSSGATSSVSQYSSSLSSGEGTAVQTQAQPETDTGLLVKSPIVGTFYDAPSPGNPPFVKVGDQVEPGKVLCIIESMKLMNEIEAEVAGTVTAKLVENGKPVEYGESLFSIHPR
jgi:acetyl-CoA carboxylase biotin carboxyl carrier protein